MGHAQRANGIDFELPSNLLEVRKRERVEAIAFKYSGVEPELVDVLALQTLRERRYRRVIADINTGLNPRATGDKLHAGLAAYANDLIAAGAEVFRQGQPDAAIGTRYQDVGHQSGSAMPEPPISEGMSRILVTPSWMCSTVSW